MWTEKAAVDSPGTTIARLSHLPGARILAEFPGGQQTTGINYGVDKVRFTNPVKSGARVRGTVTLVALTG